MCLFSREREQGIKPERPIQRFERILKAIAKLRPEPGFDVIDAERPKLGQREIIVKVKATSICGTDYHIYKWDEWAQARIKLPRILGHEFAGEIVEVSEGVSVFSTGEAVVAESHMACGTCYQCRTGNSHICEKLKILGVDVDGSFAEYVKIPEQNAWRIPKNTPFETATILEPLGNAVHATFAANPAGCNVVVFGCGPIGLSAVAVARASGALSVTAVDVNNYRLKLATKMGADRTFNSASADPVANIHGNTEGRGADVILEMSGNERAIRQAFKAIRNGGTVVLFGIPSKDVALNIADDVIFKEAQVRGVIGREMFRTWYKLEALLKSGKLNLKPLITHRMSFNRLDEAMKLIASGNCGKIVLKP